MREAWLNDSIEKDEPQPLDAYDVVSDLAVDGKEIQWDMQDRSQEALESLNAEVNDSDSSSSLHNFRYLTSLISVIQLLADQDVWKERRTQG